MGVTIVDSAFAASAMSLVQHGRASKYFGERHLWPSHLQAHLAAACWRGTNPGTGGGNNHDKFSVGPLIDL